MFYFIEQKIQNLNIVNSNWNGQAINTNEKNIVDITQTGSGEINENNEFSGIVIGVDSSTQNSNTFGLFAYENNAPKGKFLSNGILDLENGELYVQPDKVFIIENNERLTLKDYIKSLI